MRQPMRVLVIQNFDGTGLGQVGDALAEVHADVDLRRAHHGDALPGDASDHDALVLLGGGQNALADDAHPYFPALLALARDFEGRDKAVLGICLGSQLLARAFGGSNQIGGAGEFGWCEVDRVAEAEADPVLGTVPDRFPIFQWHDDTFGLPRRAVRLAGSRVAANQAFRIGRATYGIQFHFEADRRLVSEWNTTFAAYLAEHQPGWLGRWEEDYTRHGATADAVGRAIARAWVATIETGAERGRTAA